MSSDENYVTGTIAIDVGEWQQVQRLLSCVIPQESRALGFVRLRSDGERRWWYATDNYRLVRFAGEPDTGTYEILIPPRLVVMAQTVAGDDGETEVILRDDPGRGGPTIAVRGSNGEAEVVLPQYRYPNVDQTFAILNEVGASIVVDDDVLFANLASVGLTPGDPKDQASPTYVRVGMDEGLLWLRTDWDDLGASLITIHGEGGSTTAPLRFNLGYFSDLVRFFDDPVKVTLGTQVSHLKLEGGPFTATLMGAKQDSEILRDSVEEVIDTVFGPDSLQRDQDGDYQIKVVGVPIWGRLIDGDPARLSVFATLLTEVEGTPDLLAELNDLNSNLTFVRVDWRDGIVTARVDLVAGTLDPAELFTAFKRVNDAASNISPMLNAMFGGDTLDRDAERWSAYLETTITAEVVPNSIESLNGPTASEQWLFDSPVHVITAWNPYNIIRSSEENDRSNTELAVALAGRGARFARARGSANDGLHYEDSFITWNLTREDAIDIGREFRQEAVFELTADEFRLVHCGTGAIASAPRT